jgi:hypothetical protein
LPEYEEAKKAVETIGFRLSFAQLIPRRTWFRLLFKYGRLEVRAANAFSYSPQILVEESIKAERS